jgi:hypothetical protein
MAKTRSKSKIVVPAEVKRILKERDAEVKKMKKMLKERDAELRKLKKENTRLCNLNEVFIDDASKFQLRCEYAERVNFTTRIGTGP